MGTAFYIGDGHSSAARLRSIYRVDPPFKGEAEILVSCAKVANKYDTVGVYTVRHNVVSTVSKADVVLQTFQAGSFADNSDPEKILNAIGYTYQGIINPAARTNVISAPVGGCVCARCNMKNAFAAPNKPDGSYICYNCR